MGEVRCRYFALPFFAWIDSLVLHGQAVRIYMINGETVIPDTCLSRSEYLALPLYNGLGSDIEKLG